MLLLSLSYIDTLFLQTFSNPLPDFMCYYTEYYAAILYDKTHFQVFKFLVSKYNHFIM
jgi:hypothetical protein